jgi:Acetyltransferase (GNAT) domain
MTAMPSLVSRYRRVRDLPPQALDLIAAHVCERQCLQVGQAWYQNMEDNVFANDRRIEYLVLANAGQIEAVLPLITAGPVWAMHARALGNYYTCLFEPALHRDLTPERLALLFRELRRAHPGIATLTLSPMEHDGRTFRLLAAALRAAGWRFAPYLNFGNWHLRVSGGWKEYLASRDGKLRSTIKRMKQRLLVEEGTVEILATPEDLERGARAYDAVYARSWKVPEPSVQFMPGLMQLCAAAGAMRLGLVWLKGQPIAAQLWIVVGQRAEIYKVAYDEAFKTYSPGTVLTAQLMEHVLEVDKVTEVDYLIGDDAYKKSWMSDRRERWGLVAFNLWSPLGIAHWAVETAKRWLKPFLKQPARASK